MRKRPVSNPLALAVLGCLWERPMYPYEMTTTMRERGKEDSIRLNFGSLYSVIKSLEKNGLIEVEKTERDGNRPERIVYAITDTGRLEADDWLREILSTPNKEYPAIETGLSLIAMLAPDVAARMLTERLARLGAELAIGDASLRDPQTASLPELFLIEFHYKLDMMRAERRFIQTFVDRINDGTVGGLDMWSQLHTRLASGETMEQLRVEMEQYFGQEASEPSST